MPSASDKNNSQDFALYHVGLKVLLKKGDTFLILTDARRQRFDFPGGRIDASERYVPLGEILAREIREELGENVHYTLGRPVMQFRRYFAQRDWHIFLTVYEADYLSGEIRLSAEHTSFRWIDPKKDVLRPEDFYNAEEFTAIQNCLTDNFAPA